MLSVGGTMEEIDVEGFSVAGLAVAFALRLWRSPEQPEAQALAAGVMRDQHAWYALAHRSRVSWSIVGFPMLLPIGHVFAAHAAEHAYDPSH